MNEFKLFGLIYVIAVALIYALQRRAGIPVIIPGDLYINKGTKRIYIPLASSLLITILLFLILRRFLPQN